AILPLYAGAPIFSEKFFAFYNYIFVITLLYFYMIHLFQEDLIIIKRGTDLIYNYHDVKLFFI
ncbi:MAG TPA: hypothetical protein PLE45_10945, partial [Spirochaetota bacterium]|nr:hypothetical protein [Spirochaetota bacterium]HOL57445.1 hypothetical protein [Spirochaetota bacterium]